MGVVVFGLPLHKELFWNLAKTDTSDLYETRILTLQRESVFVESVTEKRNIVGFINLSSTYKRTGIDPLLGVSLNRKLLSRLG